MDRRTMLRAAAMAGVALSSVRAFAQPSGVSPVMQTLSDYMAAAGSRPLPDEATEHAKHHLLDTLASMISGSELLPGQAAQRYIRAHGGKGAASIAGTKLTAAPGDAVVTGREQVVGRGSCGPPRVVARAGPASATRTTTPSTPSPHATGRSPPALLCLVEPRRVPNTTPRIAWSAPRRGPFPASILRAVIIRFLPD